MLIKKSDGHRKARNSTGVPSSGKGEFDRRTFLRRSGLAAGALGALGVLPLGGLHKAQAGPPPSPGATVATRKNICTHCSVGSARAVGALVHLAARLKANTIHLDCEIPYIEVLPDGRRVKTEDSIRQVPLVGCALAAMKLQPKGFPRYLDKGASLSALVNKYLLEKGLRPTPKHSAYSLRHTFKDRLIAAECQDSMIEGLMGHSDDHPKYGSGPALGLKLKVLQAISFRPPSTL
jgi:hypothetical protein